MLPPREFGPVRFGPDPHPFQMFLQATRALDPMIVALLRDVLTFPEDAEDGSVISVGLPVTLTKDGSDVTYDRKHPLPEILINRSGIITVGTDDHISPAKTAAILKLMKAARQDIWSMPHAASACLSLGQSLIRSQAYNPERDHPGMIAWLCFEYATALCWSHSFNRLDVAHCTPGITPEQMCSIAQKDRKRLETSGVSRRILLGQRSQSGFP